MKVVLYSLLSQLQCKELPSRVVFLAVNVGRHMVLQRKSFRKLFRHKWDNKKSHWKKQAKSHTGRKAICTWNQLNCWEKRGHNMPAILTRLISTCAQNSPNYIYKTNYLLWINEKKFNPASESPLKLGQIELLIFSKQHIKLLSV